MKISTLFKKLIDEPFSQPDNKKHPVAYKILTCLAEFIFAARYYILKPFGVCKIGFLRVKDEQDTILACLESVEDFLDIIVIIYAQNTDKTIDLMQDYIDANPQRKKKIHLHHYKWDAIPPHNKLYQIKNAYKTENTLASYYNFGHKICKKFARFRNGFIVKIDADQIYISDCFNKIYKTMDKEKYLYAYYAYGYDGHIHSNSCYSIDYSHKNPGYNGGRDYVIVPNSLACFSSYKMHIDKSHSYEILLYKTLNNITKCIFDNVLWFHFYKRGTESSILKPLTQEQYFLYKKYVLPIFEKHKSPCKDLVVMHD